MSKLDKVKYVLEEAMRPLSIDQLVSITRFDRDLVEFMISELKTTGKIRVEPTGEVAWISKTSPTSDATRMRKVI